MRTPRIMVDRIGPAGLAGAAVLALLAGPSAPADPPTTDVTELVAYCVDNDKSKFLRYAFNSATVKDLGDFVGWNDVESLAYIPTGPHKGFYATDNYDDSDLKKSRLLKVDPLLAPASIATPFAANIGYGYVVGMLAWEKSPGNWVLIASHYGKVNEAGGNVKNIIEIDPATGVGGAVWVARVNYAYEGLARDASGQLYGLHGASAGSQQTLRKINFTGPGPNGLPLAYGQVLPLAQEPLVFNVSGAAGGTYFETIEFAFGNYQNEIQVPGIPPGWVGWDTNGVLLGFDDVADKFSVFNPNAPGGRIVYNTPFVSSDLEGIVFFTDKTDPYGAIVVDAHD